MLRCGMRAEDLCADVVRTETLVRLYAGAVLPVDTDDLDEVTVMPPDVPKKIGRPKGRRFEGCLEGAKGKYCCSVCGQAGHNKRSCTAN